MKQKDLMDSSIWHGKLNLIYQYEEGKTKLSSAYHQTPFKLQKSFYPDNNNSLCHTIILHTAGGIVGGDSLSKHISLKDNCQTLITTPTANKIYKTNGKTAVQHITIHLDNNSSLDYLPQENIIFNGAEYSQKSSIHLSENTCYCQWEINRFGRTARKEKFTYGSWKSITEVFFQDQLIWCDRTKILGNETMINSPNGLAGDAISGTFCWFGEEVKENCIQKMRELAKERITEGKTGVTSLIKGLLCRYRGNSTGEVKKWFMDVWQYMGKNYGNRSKIIPRVWQI